MKHCRHILLNCPLPVRQAAPGVARVQVLSICPNPSSLCSLGGQAWGGRAHLRLVVRREGGLRLAQVRRDHADHRSPVHLPLQKQGLVRSVAEHDTPCGASLAERSVASRRGFKATWSEARSIGQRQLSVPHVLPLS